MILQEIPFSTSIIMLLSLLIDAFILLLHRRVIGIERMKILKREQELLMKELKKAYRTGGKEAKGRIEKRKERLKQIQLEIINRSLKLMLLTIPLWIIIFSVVGGVPPYLGIKGIYHPDLVVAYLPFRFGLIGTLTPKGTAISFIPWYIICSISFSSLLHRILGMR